MGPAAAQPDDDLFRRHEVVIGSAKRQTVLTGFLLDGAVADLAVVSIDDDSDRRLSIYAFGDGTWEPRLDASLGPEVRFVDVAKIDGCDRLIMYEHGRLNWFDPESATQYPLVTVTSDFNPPPRGEVPHVDVTRDVNGDDRDDLVVPDADGFWVFIQMRDGMFADPVKIGSSPEMGRIYGADGYRYDPWVPGRVHEMDYDRDGRSDLVFWNEDHFEAHLQDKRGLFASTGKIFTTEITFDSDELASLVAPQEVRDRRPDQALTGDLTGRVLQSLSDRNGDGIGDLVVFSLKGGSLLRMRSTYEIHFGRPAPNGGTVFEPDVGTSIESDGILFGMDSHDLDRDGQVDIMFTSIKPGVFKMIGALLTRSISLDLEFYRMDGGQYPDKPDTTRRTRADSLGKAGGRNAFFPSVLLGDVNGDGHSDLLVGRSRDELRVFLGVPGPELFANQPRTVAAAMPSDEEYSWLVDLDKDGKQDILMHHPSTTGPHRLTLLIAR